MRRMVIAAFMLNIFMSAMAQGEVKNYTISEVYDGWESKTINHVRNGSLRTMIERFDQTWPTWVVGLARETMKKGLAKEVLDEETSLTVIVDTKNAYVEVSDGGTDGEYMSACYWNRKNGHKLLAVHLGKPTDPCLDFVCFYDYDPQKKTLTPEPEILKGYKWAERKPFVQVIYTLPRVGKNLMVEQWGKDGAFRYTLTWDGMKPVLSKTETPTETP